LYTALRGLCAALWLTRSIASRAANIKHRRGLAIHATRPVAWPRFRVGLSTMLSTFCAAFFRTHRGGLFASAAYAAAICFRKLFTLSRIRCAPSPTSASAIAVRICDENSALASDTAPLVVPRLGSRAARLIPGLSALSRSAISRNTFPTATPAGIVARPQLATARQPQ